MFIGGQKVNDVRIMVEEIDFAESKNRGEKTEAKSENKDSQYDFMNLPPDLVETLPFS